MSKTSSHIHRTLGWFRARGFIATKAEVWVPFVEVERASAGPLACAPRKYLRGGTRRDLFGIADIVALPPDAYWNERGGVHYLVQHMGSIYVQVLSVGDLAAHMKKALEVEDGAVLARMLATGNRVVMFCWRWVEATRKLCACDGAGCSKCDRRGYKLDSRARWHAEPREVVTDGSGFSVRPWRLAGVTDGKVEGAGRGAARARGDTAVPPGDGIGACAGDPPGRGQVRDDQGSTDEPG